MQEDESITGTPNGSGLPVQPQQYPLAPAFDRPDRLLPMEHDDEDSGSKAADLDLRHLLGVLLKRKWTILSTFGIVFLTVLLLTLLKTPIYRASATIQIDRDTVEVVQVQGMNDNAANTDTGYDDVSYYKTQYELLQSVALARRVAAQLHLANDPDYLRLSDSSPLTKLASLVMPAAKTPPLTGDSVTSSDDLGDFVGANLSIDPVRDTRLVTINFDSPSPALSAKVANAIADTFIAANLEHKFNSTAYARQYLEGRLAELKQKLAESKAGLIKLATKEKLFLDSDGKASLSTTNLDALTQALVLAQDTRTKAESRWKLANSLPDAALPGDELGASIIGTLRTQRNSLAADYQLKLNTFKPGYPLMMSEKSQIDALDKQVASEYSGIRSSMRAEYEAALAHEHMIAKDLADLKAGVLDQQNRSIDYGVMLQDVQTNQQLYNDVLERYKEIGMAGGITSNNMSIVDRADVPDGVFKPNLLRNLLVAIVLGLGLGVGVALLFEYLDDTIKSPADIEKLLGLALLGVIPRLKDIGPAEAVKDLRSAFSEAFRSVRTALQFSTNSGVPRTLLVTSATPAEGKSTTATTIALNFMQLGKRVLLIDADMRNPSQHRYFNVENTVGLSSFLSGVAKPNEAIQVIPESGLHVMTSGPLPPNPAELLAGPKLLALLTVAMAKYDQVIIDAPPTLGIADSLIIAHVAAGTIMVVGSASTRRAVIRDSVKRLMSARARIVGVVLNKFDPKMAGYGYGYGAGYGSYSYYAYGDKQAKLTRN
jgi:succinoglycan biosynthesis transport protein ExoP